MKRLLLLLPLLCTAVAARDPSALGMRVDTIVAGRDSVTGRALRAVRYSPTVSETGALMRRPVSCCPRIDADSII